MTEIIYITNTHLHQSLLMTPIKILNYKKKQFKEKHKSTGSQVLQINKQQI
jgi:hypothetical protein